MAFLLGRWGYQADLVFENMGVRFVIIFFQLAVSGSLFSEECAH